MLLVGNVEINRIRANCSDCKGLRTIPQLLTNHIHLKLLHTDIFINELEKKKNV